MKKKKVLVIVAHPDDETIWMGGVLIRNKEKWDITIVSLCRVHDKDRAPKFKKACDYFKSKSFMFNIDDEKLNPINISEIKNILCLFFNDKYDYIFSHGENGEYGHIRHIETNKAVKELLVEKKLISKYAFFFSYKKTSKKNSDTGFDSIVNKNANKFIKLNNLEFLTKKNLICNVYGFKKGGFEERNSRDIESFNKIKI